MISNFTLRRIVETFRGTSLKERALRGSLWTMSELVTAQLLRLGGNLVLTRLLFPEAFGLMAIVQVFLLALGLFSDLGIRASVIQNDRSHDPMFLDTAWTLQICRGIILWLVACVIAEPAGWFYENDQLAAMLPVAGLTAAISGFQPTRIYTANRDLLLGRMITLNLGAQLFGIFVLIVLALIMRSVWALVWGAVVNEFVRQALYMFLMPGDKNRVRVDKSALAELVHFGKWIFLSTACSFLVNHADRALLGKFIDLEMLGIYSIGFFLASAPRLVSATLTDRIVFPLYKQRPPSKSEENRAKVLRMRRLLTGFLLLISAIVAILGDWAVILLYDDRYILAGPIVVLMAISLMPTIILDSYSRLSLASGNSRSFTGLMIASAVFKTAFLFGGIALYGVLGAVTASGLASIATYPLIVRVARAYSGWDWRHDLGYGCLALTLAAIAVWFNQDAVRDLLEYALGS